MIISDLKSGVKNPNRVNVYVDGRYAFSLDVAQVVDLKIKSGLVITPEKKAEYEKASQYGKVYQRALEWALIRPRSKQELKEYLRRNKYKAEMKERQKEWQEGRENEQQVKRKKNKSSREGEEYDFSELICERLVERGYVDDRKFAEYYVENRFVKKGVSKKRLMMELMKKGVSREIIEEVVNGRDDTEEILKIIAKKRNKYDDEKLIQYLCRQGFPYEMVKNLVEEKD
ncbi:RecX family transcriptional regulator [Candidatus Saccharibacteria bacterium]|nr:RecX family transcriptional regulator [Candidatus Saccharibacteria bacterium]